MSGSRTPNANINQYLESPNSRTSNARDFFREKFNIPSDRKIILFLARLHPIKGLDTLIPAFVEVTKEEPMAVLVLVGPDDGNYKKEIIKIIKNCGFSMGSSQDHWSCEDQNINILFTGMLVSEDKISALQESDVFVLPSYSECLPMAAIEAMFFGVPVIITKNVGIAPSVEKACAGIVIEKDEKQLAEAILKILNNPNLAKEMGERGRKLVEAEFSSEKVAERWIEEYKSLI
jgi:glycosyltransferase involved in cell wall biosynthesis